MVVWRWLEDSLRIVYRCHGIFAISICTNGICIFLGQYCPANHNFYPWCAFTQLLNGFLPYLEQLWSSRHLNLLMVHDDLQLLLLQFPVEHLFKDRSHRSCSFQKNFYNVLSNVMDITLNSCKNNGSLLFLGFPASCHGILITSKAALAASALINS